MSDVIEIHTPETIQTSAPPEVIQVGYIAQTVAEGGGAVQSVDGQTGAVVLTDDYAALGHNHTGTYDPAGTASAAMSGHVAAGDPHPGYALESALGNASALNVGTTAGTVAAGDDSRITGAAQKAQNLADLNNAATARANLGVPPTSRLVTTGTGLTGGGDLSADRTHAVLYGTAAGTSAQGDDSRFADISQPASVYGFKVLSGDPANYQVNSPFGNNSIPWRRMWIPAGISITGLYFAIRTGSVHDGSNFGNRVGLFDDAGNQIALSPVDETMWSLAGWRGGDLSGAPVAAQSAGRFIRALALVRGCSPAFAFPSNPNDNNASYCSTSITGVRIAGYALGQSSMPASFDPATFGTVSGYSPLVGVK